MFLIEIAFDFSKYDLLMLQIQEMTIFSSLQPIKCFETLLCVISWNSAFYIFEKNNVIIGRFVQ